MTKKGKQQKQNPHFQEIKHFIRLFFSKTACTDSTNFRRIITILLAKYPLFSVNKSG